MIRIVALVLALTFFRAGHADELSDALKLVRENVEFVDHTPAGQLVSLGGSLITIGLAGALAIAFHRSVLDHHALEKIWYWAPGAAAAAGAGTWGYGEHLKKHDGRNQRPAPPVARLRTNEGMDEFLVLSPARQEAIARADPEFAEFILRLAEAYRFVMSNRVTAPAF